MSVPFDSAKDIPDLSGKVIVVTGGNAGLGAEVVRSLAAHNPQCIYLCARTRSKAETLIAELQSRHPSAVIKPVDFDLSSFKSAEAAAAEISSSTDRLDLLFLNAGVSGTVPALTKEGYEWQFGVNYLTHVYFTQLLMPLVLRTASANGDVRIISTASEAAKIFPPKGGILLDECKTDMSSYGAMARYGQSKLANVLFAKKMAELYPAVKSIPVHPGMVNTENYSKGNGAGWFKIPWKIMLVLAGLTAEDGARTQLWAATSPEAKSGQFYFPVGKEDDGGNNCKDRKLIDGLWAWTEKELASHGGPGWPKA